MGGYETALSDGILDGPEPGVVPQPGGRLTESQLGLPPDKLMEARRIVGATSTSCLTDHLAQLACDEAPAKVAASLSAFKFELNDPSSGNKTTLTVTPGKTAAEVAHAANEAVDEVLNGNTSLDNPARLALRFQVIGDIANRTTGLSGSTEANFESNQANGPDESLSAVTPEEEREEGPSPLSSPAQQARGPQDLADSYGRPLGKIDPRTNKPIVRRQVG